VEGFKYYPKSYFIFNVVANGGIYGAKAIYSNKIRRLANHGYMLFALTTGGIGLSLSTVFERAKPFN
jgi:hypothetical protein